MCVCVDDTLPPPTNQLEQPPLISQEYFANLLNALTSMYKSSGAARHVFELLDRVPKQRCGAAAVRPFRGGVELSVRRWRCGASLTSGLTPGVESAWCFKSLKVTSLSSH